MKGYPSYSAPAAAGPRPKPRARRWVVLAGIILVAMMLFWAFRHVTLTELGAALGQIKLWQVGLLISVNILFHALMGLRWWIIARPDLQPLPLFEVILIRLSAFGLSYFTPGLQVGGEALQVLYLRRRSGATFARAAATIILDRLIELLANVVFLLVGASLLLKDGLLGAPRAPSSLAQAAVTVVLAWPAVHIALLWLGKYPLSALVRLLRLSGPLRRAGRIVNASEHLAGRFCQRRPRALLAAIGVSLLACAVAVMEYGLVTSFLEMRLAPWQIAGAWAAGWISFLVPLPGGLGALEASQVLALGSFGVAAATALSVALVLRARDLAFGGLGLLLGATSVRYLTREISQSAAG